MKRGKELTALLLAVMLLPLLSGCDLFLANPAPTLTAWITPNDGRVPYSATIYCRAPAGTFAFALPGETVGPESSGVLEVTVDALDWRAVVTWTDGEATLSQTVRATGNNPRPNIRGVRINGKNDLWQLEPMERTLIEVVVDHGGVWRLHSVEVEGSHSSAPFTVFYPPYQQGVCHAYWNGWIIENACIVYPVYASIDSAGLPYSPTGLDEGYPTSYRVANRLIYDYPAQSDGTLEIPAQSGFIRVTVEDEFGRLTSRTFEIPIQACDYRFVPPPSAEG